MRKLFNVLFTTPRIGMTIGDTITLIIVGVLLALFLVNCSPQVRYSHNIGEIMCFSIDTDWDGNTDYFQHYAFVGDEIVPVGRRIYTEEMKGLIQ